MSWPKKYWRLFLATAIAILAALAVHNLAEVRAQRKREAAYEVTLRSYEQVLKPGMTRKDVENYLREKNVVFRHMCCVDFKSPKSVWDDLVRIGQEKPPFVCNEKNVYVAFQFAGEGTPKSGWDSQPSDKLTAVTLYPWLEGCL